MYRDSGLLLLLPHPSSGRGAKKKNDCFLEKWNKFKVHVVRSRRRRRKRALWIILCLLLSLSDTVSFSTTLVVLCFDLWIWRDKNAHPNKVMLVHS
jgi:hypothetical protein